ncbi:glycosyltransferase [Actinomycetospora straminea]|uniref:4,4'-diaponeurosporenoate glycosyltransferase n=1 Tax=Actinomycetospora straminea TaxID=663607 RepID=A0ABP9EI03_9PSEU|nr:glycosyltransferase family 2 protein [Actinomycetospora straminea]MDD7934394.1 glycosyltransferase family 2 protein [Actinomycetospora straminea]
MSLPLIGAVVPAHDEEALLAECLDGLRVAAGAVADRARVRVLVVADACTDGTAEVARAGGADVLLLGARNVGCARAAGAAALLSAYEPAGWLATTDADSVVPPDWLAAQLGAWEAGAAAWVGTVEVLDWAGLPRAVHARYRAQYDDHGEAGGPGDAHRHVHGASLGVAAAAYRAVGGFPPLATGEDVALVARLDRAGLPVVRDGAHPVATSARTDGRAPDGFAGHLRGIVRSVFTAPSGSPLGTPCPEARRGDSGPAARIS